MKPQRQKIVSDKIKNGKELGIHDKRSVEEWWKYLWPRPELYSAIKNIKKVLVHTRVSKTHAFAFSPTDYVFSDVTLVFIFEDYKNFSVLQSGVHESWSWQHSSTMKGDRRYSVSGCFATFPFPQISIGIDNQQLEQIGERYHEHRRQLMLSLQIGLTKTYNLFHKKSLLIGDIEKVSKQPTTICEKGYQDILKLRELHVEMDKAVLSAYSWTDLPLAHDFYEVDYLPENDRIRFTISPDARREVLKRLLKLNHEIHEQEVKAGLWDKKKGKTKSKVLAKITADKNQEKMF